MSKRSKSVDIAHYSTSLVRMSSRVGGASLLSKNALIDRPRTPRAHSFARYIRHGPRYMKPQHTEFRIRTSVADLVMKELDDYDRCIFYQRVYILAKNVTLTASVESSAISVLSQYIESKTSLNVDTKAEEALGEEHMGDEEDDADAEGGLEGEGEADVTIADETSQALAKTDADTGSPELQTLEARTSKEGLLLQLTKADFELQPLKEKRVQELDFFDQFRDKVEYIVKKCENEQLSEDRFTGLMLCMGNSHTLLVLEGTEDTIAQFCQELLQISDGYFEVMRIFLVEDRIEETFFDEFLYRRAVAMNTNEKFPPPTANDPQLMGSQHWLLKEKVRIICQTLSQELRPQAEPEYYDAPLQSVIQIREDDKEQRKRRKLKPKRKKTLKRTKSPMTEVRASQAQAQAQSQEERDISRQSQNLEGIPSQQSDVGVLNRLSIQPGGNAEAEDASPIEEQLETDFTAPPAVITEDSAKTDDTAIRKDPSIAKLLKVTTQVSEEPPVPEENEEEDVMPKEILSPFALSPATYNRLLPEIQRIDLVLTSKRFYLDVPEFLRFSQEIPMQQDEDAMIWPTSYTYLPLNVFDRQPFDVNLTFGNYDVKEAEEGDSEASEEDGIEGEEDAKDDNKEKKDS